MASRDLGALLRTLHAHGYWLDAWYPIHGGADFECRITSGAPGTSGKEWGVDPDPIGALVLAMTKAELPVPEEEEEPWQT